MCSWLRISFTLCHPCHVMSFMPCMTCHAYHNFPRRGRPEAQWVLPPLSRSLSPPRSLSKEGIRWIVFDSHAVIINKEGSYPTCATCFKCISILAVHYALFEGQLIYLCMFEYNRLPSHMHGSLDLRGQMRSAWGSCVEVAGLKSNHWHNLGQEYVAMCAQRVLLFHEHRSCQLLLLRSA